MKWITRSHVHVDRVACPWLIKRFVDPAAEFLYVPPEQVMEVAKRQGAIPFDVPGVELTHRGPLCSFDAFLDKYKLADPALARLATIVRAADTDTLESSPQAPGLLAITLGLATNIPDDQELLTAGLVVYDALYRWCRSLTGEHHGWYPDVLKAEMERP